MKITPRFNLVLALVLFVLMLHIMPAAAQSCSVSGLSVTYARVDAGGFAPRLGNSGTQTQFDCIAGRDPNFASKRLPTAWEALNYWFSLVAPATGIYLQPLPAPTA